MAGLQIPGWLLAITLLLTLVPDTVVLGCFHHEETYSKASPFKASDVPDARPPPHERCFNSSTVERVIVEVGEMIKDDTIRQIFANCLPSTLDTTVWHRSAAESPNGLPYTYIITGDIPAMWLRDSTYQINPYVPLAKDDVELQQLVLGVINTQAEMILLYPFGNAFLALKHWNATEIPSQPPSHSENDTVYPPYNRDEVWEAKYELDSLASFLYLSKYYYESTGDLSFTQNPLWAEAVKETVATMRKMQAGTIEVLGNEPFNFTRPTRTTSETQNLYGKANPVKRCGLIRSFFRPSDDSTIFPFLIPSNALVVTGLEGVANILNDAGMESELREEISNLAEEVRQGIRNHAIVNHPQFGEVYAFEVDCYGSHLFMDDANFPSILSMARFGFLPKNDSVYLNSRNYVLSHEWNPYFAAGRYPGVGSPHTGLQKPWHMALAMQGMTSNNDEEEILRMLWQLRNTTGGTGFMHESYDVDDPDTFSREWFAWANTVFGDFILFLATEYPHLLQMEP